MNDFLANAQQANHSWLPFQLIHQFIGEALITQLYNGIKSNI